MDMKCPIDFQDFPGTRFHALVVAENMAHMAVWCAIPVRNAVSAVPANLKSKNLLQRKYLWTIILK